jgi:pantetheine-phosphate adenylyltransferase
MKKAALFPGSFDPFTNGHKDIVLRGLNLFDEIIIALGHNTSKNTRYFNVEMMLEKIRDTFAHHSNIKIQTFQELTAEFARRNGARYILRGLRNTTDFEYENSISQVNRHLNDDLESVFLITSPEFAAINSSINREVHRYGGDVSKILPYKL